MPKFGTGTTLEPVECSLTVLEVFRTLTFSHSLGYANMGMENPSYLQMIFVLTPSFLVDFPASHV